MAAGPTPPRPTWDSTGDALPDGWSEVVVGTDGTVLAGWTAAGDFYAYAPTADIVRVCIDTLRHQVEAATPVPCSTCVAEGGPYRCCSCCADDPDFHTDGRTNHHDVPCRTCIERAHP